MIICNLRKIYIIKLNNLLLINNIMLSQEVIEDLKQDCTFEEIQWISDSLDYINEGKTLTQEEMTLFINDELFSKYKMYV